MTDRGKLGAFLKEVLNFRWDEFCEAEANSNYKSYQASVLALVRVASEGKLQAIKNAIDRVDGKLETPVKFEYPKVWWLFPNAKTIALSDDSSVEQPSALLDNPDPDPDPDPPELTLEESAEQAVKPKEEWSLRETLSMMSNAQRTIPPLLIKRKNEVDKLVNANYGKAIPSQADTIPLVKSVIAANLLQLSESGKIEAITEVFDQIDGKLVETIKLLGDDIYLSSYVAEAPPGAIKNKEGVYMIQASEVESTWKQKLKAN